MVVRIESRSESDERNVVTSLMNSMKNIVFVNNIYSHSFKISFI